MVSERGLVLTERADVLTRFGRQVLQSSSAVNSVGSPFLLCRAPRYPLTASGHNDDAN